MIPLLRLVAGLAGWALGFSLLYGAHGLGCARGWPEVAIGPTDLLRLALVFIWGATSAGLAAWSLAAFRAPTRAAAPLLAWLTRATAITGLVAMVVSGVPVAMSRQCDLPAAVERGTVAASGGSSEKMADWPSDNGLSATAARKGPDMPIAGNFI
jgi:hypothetical protein